jgi:hypothetical protein
VNEQAIRRRFDVQWDADVRLPVPCDARHAPHHPSKNNRRAGDANEERQERQRREGILRRAPGVARRGRLLRQRADQRHAGTEQQHHHDHLRHQLPFDRQARQHQPQHAGDENPDHHAPEEVTIGASDSM